MAGRYIDLHTHSLASDGSDKPSKVIEKAAKIGLAAVALTDHDTLAGLDEAEETASKLKIDCIRGIEIAVSAEFGEMHLLGLWMPQPSQTMRDALSLLRKNRLSRNQAMLDALAAKGMALSMEEVKAVSGGEALGRPHIALALYRKGYVSSRKEAFERYIGWGKEAYVPRILLSPQEGIRLLREEGATVAVAHPCLSPWMTEERLNDILSEYRACGLTAVEAYHSGHDDGKIRLCVKMAAKHGLLLTGGSDYHGENKENVALGVGKGNLRIPFWVLTQLREHRKRAGLWV